MKHLAFLSVLAIVLPLSGLRAAPDKAKGNPLLSAIPIPSS